MVINTLDAYLNTVVTPTLEAQQKGGCVAVKFEAAYLRSLDFEEIPAVTASRIYAKYAGGGEASHADYKALQDFLFRYGPYPFVRRIRQLLPCGRGRPAAAGVGVQ